MLLLHVLLSTFLLWLGSPSISGKCFSNDDSSSGSQATVQTISDGSIDFAINIFKNIIQAPSQSNPSGNVFISPISIWSALLITYLGTRNNTEAQLATGLGLSNLKQKKVLKLYEHLKKDLIHNATKNANYTTNLADRIYFDQNVELRKCIADKLKSEIQQVNFRTAAEPSRELINQWVEDQTNDKIQNLIPQGLINANTILVIVNAAYLKAAWAQKFDTHATNSQPFYITTTQTKQVNTMHKTATYPYGTSATLNCAALELPYSGNNISMVILLPNSNSNAQALISKLTRANLDILISQLSNTVVNVGIPKFQLEQSMDLTNNVKALGITDAFDVNKADFSGFTKTKVQAFISFIQHKTFIEVTEDGTEAAAATAIGISTTAIILPQAEFNVNRPFIFFLRNKQYKTILFSGLINDPTASS